MNVVELTYLKLLHEKFHSNSQHKRIFFFLLREKNLTVQEIKALVGFDGRRLSRILNELTREKILKQNGAVYNLNSVNELIEFI